MVYLTLKCKIGYIAAVEHLQSENVVKFQLEKT